VKRQAFGHVVSWVADKREQSSRGAPLLCRFMAWFEFLRPRDYIKAIASSSPLIDIAQEILGNDARPVKSVFFDKTADANWNVAWHQDTSIALQSKHEIMGFGPWSEKQGSAIELDQTLANHIHIIPNEQCGSALFVQQHATFNITPTFTLCYPPHQKNTLFIDHHTVIFYL
jgi:hypothetical protein